MTFVDEVRVFVKAGRGGDGVCSFRREKFVPRGGPDGGDGGKGGNIVVVGSRRLTTLLDLRYQQHYEAEAGSPGQGSNCHGKSAPDVIIPVPLGTLIFDDNTGELLADVVAEDQRCVIARGGKGGRGNSHFATSTNQVPTKFETGQPGEERWLKLELKLLADVGLVGLPNAGKSTLIATISAARPKIADYPFTTLIPNLGVVRWGEDRSFVVADIPGLIAGAHEGKGLGFQFLRHIDRTSFLLHLVDVSVWAVEDPTVSFETMRRELASYDEGMTAKPFAVVATKVDIRQEERLEALRVYCRRRRYPFYSISAATGEGVDDLVAYVGRQVDRLRQECGTPS